MGTPRDISCRSRFAAPAWLAAAALATPGCGGGGSDATFVATKTNGDAGDTTTTTTTAAADNDGPTRPASGGSGAGRPTGSRSPSWAKSACENLDPARVYMLGLEPLGVIRLDAPTRPCVAAPDTEHMVVDPVARNIVYVDPTYPEFGVRRLVADPFTWELDLPDPMWPAWNGAFENDGVLNDPVVKTPGCKGALVGAFLWPPNAGEMVYACSSAGMTRWYRGTETLPLEPVDAFYVALAPDGHRLGRWINTSAVFDASGAMVELSGEPITIDGDDVVRWGGDVFWLVRAESGDGVVRFVRWEITLDGVARIAARYTEVDDRFNPGRVKLAGNGDLYAVGRDAKSVPNDVGIVLRIPLVPDPVEVVYRDDGPDADDPFFVGHALPGPGAYLVTGP